MTTLQKQFPYHYAWKNNSKRLQLYLRKCRILAYGRMNTVEIEFEDGSREFVSRLALKRN